MAFQIVTDWWVFLASRVGGEAQLKRYAPGNTSGSHPAVTEAAAFATDTIRNALLQKNSEESVDALTPEKVDAEMRLHAGSLALFALSTSGTGREESVETDYEKAATWLDGVRKGKLKIEDVTEGGSVATAGQGSGLVRFRSRRRIFDRDDPDSPYNIRNPGI